MVLGLGCLRSKLKIQTLDSGVWTQTAGPLDLQDLQDLLVESVTESPNQPDNI